MDSSDMFPVPTFIMRTIGSEKHWAGPATTQIWLSRHPGRSATALMDLAYDPLLGHPIQVEAGQASGSSPATSTAPGRRARDLMKNFTVISSTLEGPPVDDGMTPRSIRLLQQLGKVVDPYLARFPNKAVLSNLMLPSSTHYVIIDPDSSEAEYNGQFSRRILAYVKGLLSLFQEACSFAQDVQSAKGLDFTSPLPTQATIHLGSRSGLRNRGQPIKTPSESAAIADADFYVMLDDEVIATMESKPGCSAHDIGVMIQDRLSPVAVLGKSGRSKSWDQKLRLQLCSQSLAAGTSKGLLIADWGRLLLPYAIENISEEDGQPAHQVRERVRLVFASTASYFEVTNGAQSCAAAHQAIRQGMAGNCPRTFQLEALPNTVFFIIAWILQVLEDRKTKAESMKPLSIAPDRKNEREEEEDERSGPSSKRRRRHDETPKRPPRRGTRSTRAAARGIGDNDTGNQRGTQSSDLARQKLLVIARYICSGAVHAGTYAAIHRCHVDLSLREDVSSGELHGRPIYGILPPLRPGEVEAYLKVQRVPDDPVDARGIPNPRFEGEGEASLTEEEKLDIQNRAARELAVFQRCRDLQGVTIPELYGLVAPENYPQSSAPKLMLEHINAGAVAYLNYQTSSLRILWGGALFEAIKEALAQLHSRRVLHNDISSANVLVEWRRIDPLSSQESAAATYTHGSAVKENLYLSEVEDLVAEALRKMGLTDEALPAAAQQARAPADFENSDSGISLKDIQTPLQEVLATIKPVIRIIDFAESEILPEGEEQDRLLAAEAHEVAEEMKWLLRD